MLISGSSTTEPPTKDSSYPQPSFHKCLMHCICSIHDLSRNFFFLFKFHLTLLLRALVSSWPIISNIASCLSAFVAKNYVTLGFPPAGTRLHILSISGV